MGAGIKNGPTPTLRWLDEVLKNSWLRLIKLHLGGSTFLLHNQTIIATSEISDCQEFNRESEFFSNVKYDLKKVYLQYKTNNNNIYNFFT